MAPSAVRAMKLPHLLIEKTKATGDALEHFLERLQVEDGIYRPCTEGVTEAGDNIRLGFSCFALKTAFTLGLWQDKPPAERQAWAKFIKGYQLDDTSAGENGTKPGAFYDRALIDALSPKAPPPQGWQAQLRRLLRGKLPERSTKKEPDDTTQKRIEAVILAETKQAIATLAQIDETPAQPYLDLPVTPNGVTQRLDALDWNAPWGAGGQASALVTLLAAQKDTFRSKRQPIDQALSAAATYMENLLDAETGTYFEGNRPDHGQLVNGAMKVLTALHWLGVPPHAPEKLIDFTLSAPPRPEGCHMVDSIYVIYQCAAVTEHRRDAIAQFANEILEMIFAHQCDDGGFSYSVGKAQTNYYGAAISEGRPCGDIHGTCLLSWAIAMCFALLEANEGTTGRHWQVITP